jgi:DNA-directed RNA polymerase subunit N (RpoN/RPB10)
MRVVRCAGCGLRIGLEYAIDKAMEACLAPLSCIRCGGAIDTAEIARILVTLPEDKPETQKWGGRQS